MHSVFKQINPELVERVLKGIKPHADPKPIKKLAPKRLSKSYRGARRNACLRVDVPLVWRGAPAHYVGYRPRSYRVEVIGLARTVLPAKTYSPNGKREIARRRRQRDRREAAP